ncbi:MAG: phage tail tape measure protein [Rhodoglobus sp.]
MFDAGAIVFNIQVAGGQVFQTEMAGAEQSAKKVGTTSKETAKATEDLGKKQETAAQTAKRLAVEQENAAKKAKQLGEETRAAQTKIGTAMFAIGAAVLVMVALTAGAAIEWESAWAGVTKTVEGTPEELGAVEDGLRDLTKVLPASHQEIAAVAEAAGQLGVQTKNVVAFTRTMIDLGETTNLSANEAATALARFMNVMGTSQDKVSNLGSSVVELGNNYATTEAEIVAMATRLSGASKQVGLTEGETLGLAAALSSVGIEAEAGGSAVSKVMIDIAASVDKGGKRLDQFAEIAGVSADEFAKKWKTDPGAALALFVKGLADAEAQGGSTLGMLEELGITEVRMRDALLRSAAASDDFTKAMETGNEAFDANNALSLEASKRYATVESKLLMMKNAVVDTAIEFGEVLLPAITATADGVAGFANLIGELPGPAKSVITVLAAAAGGVLILGGVMLLAIPKIAEFRTAQALLAAQMPRTTAALRGTAAFLGGPWGIAIAAALTVLGLLAGGNADAEARVDALTESLDQNTGAFTKNTRAQVAANLQKRGQLIEGARAYGIELNLLTDAAMGVPGALDEVKAAYDRGAELRQDGDFYLPWQTFANAVNYSTGELEKSQENLKTEKELLKESDGAADSASESHQGFGDSVDGVTSSITDLAKELDALNGKNLDAREAARQLEAAYDDFDASLAENGTTLDITTEKGRNNQAALDDIAQAALDSGQSITESGGGWEQYQASLESSRAALLTKISDLGITGQAAEDLADSILQIPTKSEWEMRATTDAAEERLRRIQNLINGIGATSTLHIATGGSGGITQADGGIVQFANGGIHESHVAQIARAGTVRVWAEPETGGEAYIPLAKSKRARSNEVMAETAAALGGVYIPGGAEYFADGGTQPGSTATRMANRSDRPMRIEGTLDLGNGIEGVLRGFLNSSY